MFDSTKAVILAFVAAIVAPGLAAPGAHRPELLGSRGIPVAHLVRPATLPALTSCPTSEFAGFLVPPGSKVRPTSVGGCSFAGRERAGKKVDEPIQYMPIDRGEIIDPDAPIGYEIVETAVAQVLVPAVAR